MERRQRGLRFRSEYAVRDAAEIIQLNQPFLQSVNVVARHADGQRARLIRIGGRHRAGGIFRIGGIELRLRCAARLPIGTQPVRPLERFDRRRRRRAVNAVHAAGIVAQLRQTSLQFADFQSGRTALEQHIGVFRCACADRFGLRGGRIELILRLTPRNAVRRQTVSALELGHGALRRSRVFAVHHAGIIAQLNQTRLQIADVVARRADAQDGITRIVILRRGRPALRTGRSGCSRARRSRRQASARPILPCALVAGAPSIRRGRRRCLRRRRRRTRRQGLHRTERNRSVGDFKRIERRVGLNEAARHRRQHSRQHDAKQRLFDGSSHVQFSSPRRIASTSSSERMS